MAVEVACRWGQRFSAPPHLGGQRVPCPSCQWPIDVPHAYAPAPVAVPYPTPIPVTCRCGGRFAAPPNLAGQTVACPTCQSPIMVVHAGSMGQAVSTQYSPYSAQPTPRWMDPEPPGFYTLAPPKVSETTDAHALPNDYYTRQYMPKAIAESKKQKYSASDESNSDGEWGYSTIGSGLLAIFLGVVWIVAGLMFNRLFFYPIYMIIAGIIAVLKGIIDNVFRR